MNTSQAAESFRGLLMRYRGRSGLTQRQAGSRVQRRVGFGEGRG